MIIQFDTQDETQVAEVKKLLGIEQNETPSKTNAKGSKKPKEDEPKGNPLPEEKKASSVTLQQLKDACKEATNRVDRADVKKAISKYAAKLTDVEEKDYAELFETVTNL